MTRHVVVARTALALLLGAGTSWAQAVPVAPAAPAAATPQTPPQPAHLLVLAIDGKAPIPGATPAN